MAWSAPYLFVAGQILTAAQLNTYVSDNLTFLKSLDNNQVGWIADTGWSYTSATTITVPAGAASRYSKGDKFKLTANAVVLQGYIVTIADTLLTVVGDVLTNHAFSAIYYSHEGTPLGFTHWFNYTPTLAQGVSTNIAKTVTLSTLRISGMVCECLFRLDATGAGTAGSAITVSLPTTALNSGADAVGFGGYIDAGTAGYNGVLYLLSTTTAYISSGSVTAIGSAIGANPNLAVANTDVFQGHIFFRLA